MRIPTLAAQPATQLLDARAARRSAGLPARAQEARPADAAARLPGAIASRLADLLAQDPGLAEAVSARLPAARLDSARDLAAYGQPSRPPRLDVSG